MKNTLWLRGHKTYAEKIPKMRYAWLEPDRYVRNCKTIIWLLEPKQYATKYAQKMLWLAGAYNLRNKSATDTLWLAGVKQIRKTYSGNMLWLAGA